MTRVTRQGGWSPRGFPFEPSDSEAQSYRCNQPYLVPGGRFLFTKSARKNHIALWDLGNVGTRERMAWLPIALLRDSRLVIMDTCLTADGSGLYYPHTVVSSRECWFPLCVA